MSHTLQKHKNANKKNNKQPRSTRRYISHKPKIKASTPIAIMKDSLSPGGCKLVGRYEFKCGQNVPIYEVENVHALNQLIGYAKFINRSYGNVYYRGECKLHDSLLPSVFRGHTNTSTIVAPLKLLIEKVLKDENMIKQLKLDISDETSAMLKIEGMLQHYGIKTRFIDLVDNHWVALWMGLNRNIKYKQILEYYHYVEREIPLVDFAAGKNCTEDDLFQYLLLLAIPGDSERINNGIYSSDDYYEIDLRQALPSTYLRPHAQHGLVVRKRPHNGDSVEKYDMATNIVGIIKIRIDRAKQWLGNGELLSQENLFPPPAFDNGYDVLLNRTDIFNGNFSIARYI